MPNDLPSPPSRESLLAFQMGEDGKPRLHRRFKDDRDRLALIQFAECVLSAMRQEVGREALKTLR